MMNHRSQLQDPPLGLGLISVVLGSVGLLLFFLPILGIPLSGFGLLFGMLGFLLALVGGPSSLRWSAAGTALCVLALGVNVAVARAPEDYVGGRPVLPLSQPERDRPYIPPPARPSAPYRTTRPEPLPRIRASISARLEKLKSPLIECARHDAAAAKLTAVAGAASSGVLSA